MARMAQIMRACLLAMATKVVTPESKVPKMAPPCETPNPALNRTPRLRASPGIGSRVGLMRQASRRVHPRSLAISQDHRKPTSESNGELIMPTGAIRLHRVLRTNPERVYRALGLRQITGVNDANLSGTRKVFRSFRPGLQCRVIHRVIADELLFQIESLTPLHYRGR